MRFFGDLLGTLRNTFSVGRAKFDASALTAARTIVLPDRSLGVGDVWEFIPVGHPFPLWTHLTGVAAPPTDNPNYRYIKLTASDSYNTGVLTGESVSGSSPLVQATAVIDDDDSPLDGQTVRLINTERRFVRAGSSGAVEADAMEAHTHTYNQPVTNGLGPPDSIYARPNGINNGVATGGASGRTANETRAKNIGADYYMRIR